MKKIDAIFGALIGFLNGVFFFFLLGQIGIKIPLAAILIFPVLAALGLFIASIIGKKFPIIFQAAKFFLVGTLNTLIDLAVLNFFIGLTKIAKGGFYSLFKVFSFLAAVINSYFWNRYWTFERKETPNPKEFLKFVTITFFGLLINVGVASFVVNVVGPQLGINERVWASVGAIIAAFFAFIWNFSASKFLIFK